MASERADEVAPGPDDDRAVALAAVFAFSFSLGLGFLALPLVALSAGYDAATVGWLTATSAISQFVFRLRLPWLLGRYPDRALIALAGVAIAASYGLLFVSTALPVFVACQLLQGGARALFWTSSQTHAVRSKGTAVQSLSYVGGVGNVSQMLGPLVTGALATFWVMAPLIVGVAAGLVAVGLSRLLVAYPPYARSGGERMRLWRRPGVDAACWAGFVGGGWRALMASYVPLVLTGAGLSPGTTGLVMSVADLTGTGTTFAMGRARPTSVERTLAISVAVTCVALALLPLVAGAPALAGLALAISGAAAGPITALSASVARRYAAADDEGEAIALVGTFRAAALLVTPATVATVVGTIAIGPALAGASLLLGLPTLALVAIRARPASVERQVT